MHSKTTKCETRFPQGQTTSPFRLRGWAAVSGGARPRGGIGGRGSLAGSAAWRSAVAGLIGICVWGSATMALGVSTYRIDVRVPAGETHDEQITLWNTSDVSLRIDVSTAGLGLEPDGSLLWFDERGIDAAGDRHPYADLASAVAIEPLSVVVPGGGEGVFLVHIEKPLSSDGQVLGGCAGALLFTATPESAANSDPLFVNVFQLITFVLVRFADATATVEVVGFDAAVSRDSGIDAQLQLLNTGAAHTTPAVSYQLIRQDTGAVVQEVQLSPGTLLPDSSRLYGGTFSPASPGSYMIRYVVEFPEQTAEPLTDLQPIVIHP